MKNKAGFIPKSLMQPQYYKKFFDLYAAVYIGSNQKEYMLQIEGNIAVNSIDGISILRQDPTCRTPITNRQFKTIKAAVLHLTEYMSKNNLIN